jgi:hypothetical protein
MFLGTAIVWSGVVGSGLFWWSALLQTETTTPHSELVPRPVPQPGPMAFDEAALAHMLSSADSNSANGHSTVQSLQLIGLMTWGKRSAALISMNRQIAQSFVLGQEVHAGLVLQKVTDTSVFLGQGLRPDASSLVLQLQEPSESGLRPEMDLNNPRVLSGQQIRPAVAQDGDS